MIENPSVLLVFFTFIVSSILYLSNFERTRIFFKYLPVPLWCYFIPTIISTLGWIPADSPFYGQMSRFLLPASLFLLLIGTHLPSIYKLSRKALLAMFAGTLGIFLGGTVTFITFMKLYASRESSMTSELWKGWGCLSASWTGGSANMIAVKEILQTPETIFSNLIIVDTITAYSWMALLIFLSSYQAFIDDKLGIEQELNTLNISTQPDLHTHHSLNLIENVNNSATKNFLKKSITFISFMILALFFGQLCWISSAKFPTWGNILNQFAWCIILATSIPLILSLTPIRELEHFGASKTGNFLLYLLLTSIGARANLMVLKSAPIFIFLGLVWVLIHGIVLILFGRMLKIPVSLLATASQANVGGTISAPIVASVYKKNLAPIGIILAVFGNVYGTYAGLFFAGICSKLMDLLK